jgi:hypothetical protein
MINVQPRTSQHLALGFALGAALTALVLIFGTALAQTPTPVSTPNVQAMIDACRVMVGSLGSTMQTMMSGACPMMGR